MIHLTNRLIIEKLREFLSGGDFIRLFLSAESMKSITRKEKSASSSVWTDLLLLSHFGTLKSNISHIINRIFYSAHTFDTVFQFHFFSVSSSPIQTYLTCMRERNEVQFPFIMWFLAHLSPIHTRQTYKQGGRKKENAISKVVSEREFVKVEETQRDKWGWERWKWNFHWNVFGRTKLVTRECEFVFEERRKCFAMEIKNEKGKSFDEINRIYTLFYRTFSA